MDHFCKESLLRAWECASSRCSLVATDSASQKYRYTVQTSICHVTVGTEWSFADHTCKERKALGGAYGLHPGAAWVELTEEQMPLEGKVGRRECPIKKQV